MIKNRNLVFSKANDSSPDSYKFLQLPQITNANLPTAASDNEGGLSYDATNNALYFSDGSSWTEVGTGATGASKALSNLADVAINLSLVSDADSTDDLGSSSVYWANSYVDRMYVNATAYVDGGTAGKFDIVGDADISGSLTIDTNLTVTGTASIGTIQMDALAASTAAATLTLDGDTSGGVNICSISTGGITLSDDTSLASAKTLTIAGTTAGVSYLTITAGTISLTDGNLNMDEGKVEIDTTTDETSYVKRNKAGGTSAMVEFEVTDTGDTGSALLIDHKGTGNAKGLEIVHAGDLASLDISASVARTGNAINIPMANQLAETAIDVTGAATGTSGEGIVHIDVTGVMAGDGFRVDSIGANAATASLFKGISTGQQAGATSGIVAHFQDTGAVQATSYTVYIDSTNNEALHVDTGNVQFDESLTLGIDGTASDLIAYSGSVGQFLRWDASENELRLEGTSILAIGGTAGAKDGLTIHFDGATVDIDAVTANDDINFGSNVDTDVIFTTASGAGLTIDHGDDTITVAAANTLVVNGAANGDGSTGLVIPTHATATPSAAAAVGSIFFEEDANKLWVRTTASWVGVALA